MCGAIYGQLQSVLQLSGHWEFSGQEYQHWLKNIGLKMIRGGGGAYQSSGPSSGAVHLLLLWSNTRPSVHPSSLGVTENSQTMYFLQEDGWGKEGCARVMPLGPMVSPSGHSKPSIFGLERSFSHFLAKEEACSSLTQVPWASSKTRGGGQSYGWG